VENPATLQENSRVGITASLPLTRHQSLKLSAARGAYIRFGGDFSVLSAAWQYSWIRAARPRAGPATPSSRGSTDGARGFSGPLPPGSSYGS
jgi:hypothetical protein